MSEMGESYTPNIEKGKNMPVTKNSNGEINTKKQPKSFEDVYAKMGPPGRFQILQIAMISTCTLQMVFVNIKYVFISLEYPFSCSAVNETDLGKSLPKIPDGAGSYVTSYNKNCEIEVFKNESGMLTNRVKTIECTNGYDFVGGSHKSFISEWELVCGNVGVSQLAQTVISIGGFIGTVIVNPIGDKYGRLLTMSISTFLTTVTEVATAYSPNIFSMIVIRFLSGVLAAGMYVCTYLLAFEMVIEKYRIFFGMIAGVIWSVVVIGLSGLAYAFRDYSWRDFQMYSAFIGLLPLLFVYFIKESPSWLHSVGKRDRCENIIQQACSTNNLDYEKVRETFEQCFQDLKPKEAEEKGPIKLKSYNALDLLKKRKYLIATVIMWLAFFVNEITNNGLLLTASTLSGDLYLNFALLGLVSAAAYFAAWIFLLFKGRRFVIVLFTVMTAICLLISSFIEFADMDENVAEKISLAFFIFGKFGISAGYNTLYIYVPETYPTSIRATGFGMALSGAPMGGALAPYLLPLSKLASWAPGASLSSCCLIISALFMILPETRGKQLATTLDDDDENVEETKM